MSGRCLFYPAQVLDMCAQVAERLIDRFDGDDRPLLFVTVMEGAAPFAKAVTQAFERGTGREPARTSIKVTSYRGSERGEALVESTALDERLAYMKPDEVNVVVLDDILDSGATASIVLRHLRDRGVRMEDTLFAAFAVRSWDSLRSLPCKYAFGTCLQTDRAVPFRLKHGFLYGFGMDLNGKMRDCKYVGIIDPREVPEH